MKAFQPLFGLALLAVLAAPSSISAQTATGTKADVTIPPGNNFDKANFRLWYPSGVAKVQAVLAIVPGSNGDWRAMVDDTALQTFATRNKLALVGLQFTDKPHDQNFIEAYCDVSKGSGQAFLDAMSSFAKSTNHAELATAPFLMWGMSAGGQFDYEFTAWKPERVVAFVVNKGGIYYTALASMAARNVPGILYIGGKDLDSRIQTITGLFALNRRGQALWALAEEPGVAHVVGRSRDVTLMFFEDVLPLRLQGITGGVMNTLTEKSGFIADPKTKSYSPFATSKAPAYPTGWLPTERVAKAWQAMLTETPFSK